MQSHNYVPGVSGWKMHSNGTLEVNGKIRAIMEDPVEKPTTPFAVEGDQVFLTQAFIDALGRTACDAETDASKVLDRLLGSISETELSEGLKNFKLEDFLSELKKEVVTRDEAEEKVAVTIGGVNYIKQSLIKGEAARLVADEIIAACRAAKK